MPKVSLVRASERDFDTALGILRATKSRVYAADVDEEDLRHLFRKGTVSLVAAKVSLAKASEKDLETVRMINSTLKSEMHTGFLDENDLQDVFKRGAIFLIKAGRETVGSFSFRPCGDDTGTALLRNLEILQEYQRGGIGTESMHLMLNILKELGFKKARLRVRPEKDMALHIYKKLGFEEVGNDNSFGDGVLRLAMEKRLR